MIGYTGISFPFRLSNKGGITLSTTSRTDISHIVESMQQILGTDLRERVMELDFGCDLDTQLFEKNDPSTHSLIKYEIVECLTRFEPRIEVTLDDIVLTQDDNKLYADIEFKVISYNVKYSTKLYVGGVDNVG